MNKILTEYIFHDKKTNAQMQLFYALSFTVFTVVALGIDSVFFAKRYFDAQYLTNLLSIVYFSLLFLVSDSHLRKLMFVMVILSYIGELIFCKLLGMYSYRTDSIPLYVPFGHAIVYASGFIFAKTKWAVRNEDLIRKFFGLTFAILFLSVGVFLNDIFSSLFGILFFLLLKRKRWENLYYFIALCVIFIELTGTFFRCWVWRPHVFDVIPTANPPMGAVFFYAGGDVLLFKIVSAWDNKTIKSKV